MNTKTTKTHRIPMVQAYSEFSNKRKILTWIIIIPILLYFSFVIVQAVQHELLKPAVVKLGLAIESDQPPKVHDSAQYCSYGSAKYHKGPRSCYAEEFFQYHTGSIEQAKVTFERVKRAIGKKYEIYQTKDLYSYGNKLSDTYDTFEIVGASCSVSAYYDIETPPSYDIDKLIPRRDKYENTLIRVSCSYSGITLASYYPDVN